MQSCDVKTTEVFQETGRLQSKLREVCIRLFLVSTLFFYSIRSFKKFLSPEFQFHFEVNFELLKWIEIL